MRTVDLQEAEANLSELLDLLEGGEETEIVLLRDGKPVARLLSFEAAAAPNADQP